MSNLTEIRRCSETLSATVVRNILSKVRSLSVRNSDFYKSFDFRHGRYDVSAFCSGSQCCDLIVRLFHRDSCEIWVIVRGSYSLLPYEAFDL